MKRKLILLLIGLFILNSSSIVSCGTSRVKEESKNKITENEFVQLEENEENYNQDANNIEIKNEEFYNPETSNTQIKYDKVDEIRFDDVGSETVDIGEMLSKSTKDKLVNEAQKVLYLYNYGKIGWVEFIKVGEEYGRPKELINKKLVHFTEVGESSPREFYYDYKNKELYQIDQGMWFEVTDDYKNITPEGDDGYREEADRVRESFKNKR